MADEKVVYPEVQQDNPFPQEVTQSVVTTEGSTSVATPTTTTEKTFPTRKIATELISSALNTKSKKILQELELTQSGAIRIGNYKEGVSGEVLITADGIVTKDKAGLVTIAIYGEDGSGTFKGAIQAGSIITGIVDVGDNSIIIDGEAKRMVFYDDNGIPSILIGNP
jgi:hypothetical protein